MLYGRELYSRFSSVKVKILARISSKFREFGLWLLFQLFDFVDALKKGDCLTLLSDLKHDNMRVSVV